MNLRSLAESIGLHCVRWLGNRSLTSRRRLAATLAPLLYRFGTRDRKIATSQIQLGLGCSQKEARSIAREVFHSVASTALESLDLANMVASLSQGTVLDASDRVHELLKPTRARGVLALSGHLGNWDYLCAYMNHRDVGVAPIGRKARKQRWQALLESIRKAGKIETLWREDRNSTRQLVALLKGKGLVAALIDQDMQMDGQFCDFLGIPAHHTTSLIEMALRYRSDIISAFCIRTANGNFRLVLKMIDPSGGVSGVLQQYSEHLEQLIHEHPTQWVWFHKRWRTRPLSNQEQQERLSSKQYQVWLKEQLEMQQANAT